MPLNGSASSRLFLLPCGPQLLARKKLSVERILKVPFVGTRMPPRVAQAFLETAKAGAIDRATGDYLPPIKVESMQMVKDIVLARDAVAVAPLAFITQEIALQLLVPLRARAAWMQTGYGFVSLRGVALSPAAEAFKDAVRRVEKELAAAEQPI